METWGWRCIFVYVYLCICVFVYSFICVFMSARRWEDFSQSGDSCCMRQELGQTRLRTKRSFRAHMQNIHLHLAHTSSYLHNQFAQAAAKGSGRNRWGIVEGFGKEVVAKYGKIVVLCLFGPNPDFCCKEYWYIIPKPLGANQNQWKPTKACCRIY